MFYGWEIKYILYYIHGGKKKKKAQTKMNRGKKFVECQKIN